MCSYPVERREKEKYETSKFGDRRIRACRFFYTEKEALEWASSKNVEIMDLHNFGRPFGWRLSYKPKPPFKEVLADKGLHWVESHHSVYDIYLYLSYKIEVRDALDSLCEEKYVHILKDEKHY